jgi:hypothetical protein
MYSNIDTKAKCLDKQSLLAVKVPAKLNSCPLVPARA